jgi:hypothetical protein
MICRIRLAALMAVLFSTPTQAALVLSHQDWEPLNGATVDGTISANEYGTGNSLSYTGGGTGFGGPLGNGTLYMESTGTTLYVGAQIASNLGGNIIAVFLHTRSGGFSDDSTLGDFADGGRRVASNLTRDVQDNLPVAADFVLEFGNGFTNLFELKTGSLNFISTTAAGSGGSGGAGAREASIPLSTLGIPNLSGFAIDFFTVLISDSGYSSNEGIPSTGFAGTNGGPGFNNYGTNTAVTWPDFDRFIVSTPEPTTLLIWGLIIATVGFVRQRNVR